MTEIFRRIQSSQLLRFLLVGGAGFFVNMAALWLAINLAHLDVYSGQALAFLCAVTFTWWGNRTLTFAEHAADSPAGRLREWGKFIAANSIGGLVNYAVYVTLVTFAPAPFSNPYLAVAAGTIAGLAFNFTMSKRFVFRA